jgi:4,5-dihydroxyphthalate decarboxylase
LGTNLTIAVGDYDHTRDLLTGRVGRPGLRYSVVAGPEELFQRVLESDEFAAAEMSLAIATTLAGRGDQRFALLPVFPARSFRHGAIWTHADGPSHPSELDGARIGIPVWVQTAGVYLRGILAARYGLDLTSVEWVRAGVDDPGRREPVAFDAGSHTITTAADATLDELLLDHEVDAVISARPPACAERGDPRVRRLFADPEAEERAYFLDTSVFPIMHVLVLRRSMLSQAPGLAADLASDFTTAKDNSLRRALSATVPSYPMPWASLQARAARELLGEDFWPYGVEPNRAALDAFLGYAHGQGLTDRVIAVDDLFACAPSPRRSQRENCHVSS